MGDMTKLTKEQTTSFTDAFANVISQAQSIWGDDYKQHLNRVLNADSPMTYLREQLQQRQSASA